MFKNYALEASIGCVLFIALFAVVLLQVFGRTGLFVGVVWTEETARWLWVWMALIGIGAVERNQSHLRMGLLTAILPQGFQRGLNIFFDLVYLGIACHLVWIAYKSVLRTWNNESVSLPTTDALLYASALVAFVLIVHRIIRRLVATLRNADIEPEAKP
ncbi:TRAP transporter small permease [Mariluticola halotolerans]|uniref:TRAP transporter small permease n=1 Tax=Mariluticola halotolerans TaxID=2909283 RepID=UPI0026E470C7|nr:TRAP transporter small permease [Mariluticola halotolerans]UJQ93394.1 TRAP transporter small permease [Mariluticola halotolerans]